MIKILFEDNHLLVVEKPVNIPVQEDNSKDRDLLSILKEDLKIRYNKLGNVYLGLVHRLDRPVGGVMIFAKTSKAASRLSDSIRKNELNKKYKAVICTDSFPKSGTLTDYLIKNPKTNTSSVTTSNKGKKSVLSYKIIEKHDDLNLVEIDLETGRSHQIRVQFSSRNAPLFGDQRYNKNAKAGQQIALWATSLTIIHPVSKIKMTFESKLPEYYPWNLFKGE